VAVSKHELGCGCETIVFGCAGVEGDMTLAEDFGEEGGTGGAYSAVDTSGAGAILLIGMGGVDVAI